MSDNLEAPVAENVADTATNEGTTTEASAPSQSTKEWLANNAPEGASTDWLNKYTDDASLAKGIFSAQTLVGKKAFVPGEEATSEAKLEFAEKLGFVPSEEAQSFIELDADKWGDHKASLEEMYNGAGNSVIQKAIENFRANPSPEAFVDAVKQYIAEDAEQSFLQQVEDQKAAQQQFKDLASKVGLAPEQLEQGNQEVMKRMGWDNNTSIHEIVHEFNKMTSNSKTLQEAHLHNTVEGIDQQIEQLRVVLNDRSVPDQQHALNVKEMTRLLQKKSDIVSRS